MSEARLKMIINQDPSRIKALEAVQSLKLPDWWIGAGFVRNPIWDILCNATNPTALRDIDVIYFDQDNLEEKTEKGFEKKLSYVMPDLPWSVTNQARYHIINGDEAYRSSIDALSKWPETATAIAIKLNERNEIEVAAPHGLEDLFNLIVRPTPYFKEHHLQRYNERITQKKWTTLWPQLTFINE